MNSIKIELVLWIWTQYYDKYYEYDTVLYSIMIETWTKHGPKPGPSLAQAGPKLDPRRAHARNSRPKKSKK